jgi:hypothetical protein
MKIRVGCELIYDFPYSTPVIMVLRIHSPGAFNVIVPDYPTSTRMFRVWTDEVDAAVLEDLMRRRD